MKSPNEWDTPEPATVGEIPKAVKSSTEAREEAMKAKLEIFSDQLATDAIEKFWPKRPIFPELNGNGVTKEELLAKVSPTLKANIIKNLHVISVLVHEAKDPQRAFQAVTALFGREAMEFSKIIYESLIFFKKIGIDELTGFPNRSVLERNIRVGVERNKRFGEKFSLVLFDIDHFKIVNDTYGHLAGDMVLQELARRLSNDVKLRELDTIVRFGGEEFFVILPSTPKEGACILAQRIADCISNKPFHVEGKSGDPHDIKVTISTGVSEFSSYEHDPSGTKVKQQADTCLYIVKGDEKDNEETKADRRGQIACENRIITREEIETYKVRMKGAGRSSRPISEGA